MNKRARQYLGLILAILSYYLIHEGAHLVYALATGVFKRINFMGFGMQIDVFAERLSNTDLGIFCLVGSIATLIAAYILVFLAKKISSVFSKVFKASMYYITIALLILDPLYLSLLCGFFSGGDMNGISLLIPEIPARILYGIIFAVNLFIFIKIVLPKYKAAFSENDTQEL
jgi:hypothetical protein